MMAALAPIEACPAKGALLVGKDRGINSELPEQALTLRSQLKSGDGRSQRVFFQQPLVDGHSDLAGKVVIANPRFSHGRLARTRTSPQRACPEGDPHQRFEQVRDILVGEAEISMPPLAFDPYQSRVDELREMGADCLLGYARQRGKFRSGKRPIRQQGSKNLRPRMVPDERRDTDDIRAVFHCSMVDEPSFLCKPYPAMG